MVSPDKVCQTDFSAQPRLKNKTQFMISMKTINPAVRTATKNNNGQTTAEVRQRFRSKFKFDADKSYTKSALSQHCFNEHPESMNLSNFKVAFVKKCPAIELDREEHRLISIFRPNIWGLIELKL